MHAHLIPHPITSLSAEPTTDRKTNPDLPMAFLFFFFFLALKRQLAAVVVIGQLPTLKERDRDWSRGLS